ncbi:MAG: hypothetical protein ACR2MG_07570 [Pyrinomonadaceae bacterium]
MKSVHSLEFDELNNYDTLKIGITLPVLLISGEFETTVEAKVDTGASHSIFARVHGENLGFNIESGEPLNVGTVRGNFRAFGHDLTIRFLDIELYLKIYFAEDETMRRSVLGRQGWLDRVKLGLIDYESKLLLSPYGE